MPLAWADEDVLDPHLLVRYISDLWRTLHELESGLERWGR